MSNVNNYAMAKHLDQFKIRILDPQTVRVRDAQKIMNNSAYPWENNQKELAEKKLQMYKDWLAFYQEFHDQGMIFVKQHEGLTNNVSKWYDSWYENISNDGKQEPEMMSMQAEILHGIFEEMFLELKPLGLDIKSPKALNL